MRHKKFKLSAILLLGLGLTGLQAQIINVKESSGTKTTYSLNSIRKMTFSGGNVTVQKTDNSTVVYALNGLRYLNFSDNSTGIFENQTFSGNTDLHTYPNPVSDFLNINLEDIAGEGTISILSLEGKVMQTQKTRGASIVTLNLSELPRGIYLCRYSNEREIKTVKIIKH